MVGDRGRGVANDWQAELPSFSATIFRAAPHLGLGAETELPSPVRGASASSGSSAATIAVPAPVRCSSALRGGTSRGGSSTATIAALPARAKRWQQKAAASTAARRTATEAGQHLPRQSSIADQAASTLPSWLLRTLQLDQTLALTLTLNLALAPALTLTRHAAAEPG